MLKKVLIVVLLLLAGLALYINSQPAEFTISRSATISAPADDIFEQINDFHNWQNWSPWAQLDPNAQNSFEGPKEGVGAVFKWSGNKDVGEGSNTIIVSQPYERIEIQLNFIKPFEATSTAEFTLKPIDKNNTQLTWNMHGENNFIGKAISLLMDCDKMVGTQFEEGLNNLKSVVE